MDDKQLALSAFAWTFNVSTSVCIVFVNKVLMGSNGYRFNFAVTLCALHFLASSVGIWLLQCVGLVPSSKKRIPWADRIIFSAAANTSISALNLSLMINTVGFYQVAKLLIIPFTAAVEAMWLGEWLSTPQSVSTALVVGGVAIFTVSDVSASLPGIAVASVSIASSAMQQILCRYYLRKHDVSSFELLGVTAPLQGWTLLLLGPVIDKGVGGRWVSDFELNVPALTCLGISCLVALLVNVSQFMCLGRFSAVTFQVTGHAKTIAVLLGSWAYLDERVGARELLGMSFAVVGMIAYSYFSARKVAAKQVLGLGAKNGNGVSDKAPLLPQVSK